MADNQQHLVNIAKAIEKGTRVTTLDELKAKGQNQVKVINAAKIMELIREAVDLAIDSMSGQKLSAERERLQSAAKKEFDELFRKYQDTQKSKEGIEGQASKMQSEIDAIQKLLAGGGSAEAQMGLAGLSGQISGLVQKLQASEKSRIDLGSAQQRMEREMADLKAKLGEAEAAQAAAVSAGRGVASAVDAAYAKIDAGLGMKARELGLFTGAEPRTPEEKMQRLAEIAEAAASGLEKERGEKAQLKRQLGELEGKSQAAERELALTKEFKQSLEKRLDEQGKQIQETVQAKGRAEAEIERLKDSVSATEAKKSGLERELAVAQEFKKSLESKSGDQGAQISKLQSDILALQSQLAQTQGSKASVEQKLAQTEAKKQVSEKELGELQEFKRKLEEKVSESGDQYAEVHQMMAQIGKRADDLIHEVEHGRLKHLKPEEKKIILDAMADVKEQVRKLQEERAFLEKKLFYMSMTIDSLEAELLAAKGLTPSVGGSIVKDDGLQVIFDEAGVATL
ncbi:MAG: hypothetical protein HUU15_03960 [Candidatus Brocadiae bacterium]|nr:hypothetical protein [Candidatus Brocadiia bacterium]